MAADFENQKAEAAKWMYSRQDRPVEWWRWTVLTAHNLDPDSLKLDPKTAFLIFADLVPRGMLLPIIGSDGLEAYTINLGRDAEWSEVMSPGFHLAQLFGWKALEMLISGIVGAVLGAIATAMMM